MSPVETTAFAATWQSFCAADRLLGPTPGHREAWAGGRRTYAVWGVRVSTEAVHRRVHAVQNSLPAGLRRLPLADLHVTIWVAGFPTDDHPTRNDDIREADLDAHAHALAGCGRFRLRIGAANSFTTAPFLEVFDPDGGLAAVRGALDRSGPRELRFAAFQPHLTLATATEDRPTAPLRDALLPHRLAPPLEVDVCRIDQLRFDATCPAASLQTHRSVDLS